MLNKNIKIPGSSVLTWVGDFFIYKRIWIIFIENLSTNELNG